MDRHIERGGFPSRAGQDEGPSGYVRVEYSGRLPSDLGGYLEELGFTASGFGQLLLRTRRPEVFVGRVIRFLSDADMRTIRVEVRPDRSDSYGEAGLMPAV